MTRKTDPNVEPYDDKHKTVIDAVAADSRKKYEAPTVKRVFVLVFKTNDRRDVGWIFDTREKLLERGRILAGLAKLRGIHFGEDDRDDEYHLHYDMPYSFEEMSTIFGPFEELT